MKAKFPKLIHVTEEGESGDTRWLEVHPDGVMSVEVTGQEVAIYQCVDTGRVKIVKSFVSKRKRVNR